MNIWRITKYRCDQNGVPYGDPIQSLCFTQELMESYKNPKFVIKIEEQVALDTYKVIWTKEERTNESNERVVKYFSSVKKENQQLVSLLHCQSRVWLCSQ